MDILFSRPYWLDEWHAVLVANRPSLAGVWSDLRQGSDFAPPLLHVALWLLRVSSGGGELSPVAARSLMLAFTLGALVFTYLLLRRRFDRLPSVTGALAIATHALVWAYAFEVRFYAPWLFFAAMLAWALSTGDGRGRSVLIAVAAVGMCLTHWFGVVTLGVMCAGATLASLPDWRTAARRLLPAAAGIVATAACAPLLFGQRGSIREKTWIEPLTAAQFGDLVTAYWGALPVLVALGALVAMMLSPRSKAQLRSTALPALRDPAIAAVMALGTMPLVLTVISLVQPAMLPRYGITTVLAWGPLFALVSQMLPRLGRLLPVALLGFGVLLQLGGQLSVQRSVDRMVRLDRTLLREACKSAGAVAFVTRLQMYYYVDEVRRECPRAAFLRLPQPALERLFVGPNARVQVKHRVEEEFALMHQRLYDFPKTVTPAQLDSLPHFVVMVEPWSLPRDASGNEFFSRVVFPNHRATPLNGNGMLYVRASATP